MRTAIAEYSGRARTGVPRSVPNPVRCLERAAIAAPIWEWYDWTIFLIMAFPFVVIMFRWKRIRRRKREDVAKRKANE